jgi:hypothetical protein
MRFLRSAGQEGSTGNLHEFAIDPANADPIFTGDLVALNGGYVEEASGAADNNDFMALGVFQGCKFVDPEGGYNFRNYWSGATGRTECYAMVSVPAGSTFLIQGDGVSTYAQSDIGTRKGIVYAAGNALNGQSGILLGAAGATVATGPLLVLKQVDIPDGRDWFEVAVVRDQFGLKAA